MTKDRKDGNLKQCLLDANRVLWIACADAHLSNKDWWNKWAWSHELCLVPSVQEFEWFFLGILTCTWFYRFFGIPTNTHTNSNNPNPSPTSIVLWRWVWLSWSLIHFFLLIKDGMKRSGMGLRFYDCWSPAMALNRHSVWDICATVEGRPWRLDGYFWWCCYWLTVSIMHLQFGRKW